MSFSSHTSQSQYSRRSWLKVGTLKFAYFLGESNYNYLKPPNKRDQIATYLLVAVAAIDKDHKIEREQEKIYSILVTDLCAIQLCNFLIWHPYLVVEEQLSKRRYFVIRLFYATLVHIYMKTFSGYLYIILHLRCMNREHCIIQCM